jgi:aminoglycoside phosphotransferase (APT) family kinase protein
VAAELDLGALHEYLTRSNVDVTGPLTAALISGGRSNLTYVVSDGATDWIMRRPPQGDILSGAHDVAREHRVMQALAATPVPVPTMVALCEDEGVLGVPFYVMDRIDGQVLRTTADVAAITAATRARLGACLVDTLADLHDVPYDSIGLGTLGRPVGYLHRQVERWAKQYQQIKIRELPHVDEVISVLRATVPANSMASIVHGDYRIDNVIVTPDDPGRIAGVLDWEMATLGDPLADLGMLVMFWDEVGKPFNPITGGLTAFPGFPDARGVIEHYVTRRSLSIDDIDWYLVFSEYKLAIIMEQIYVRFVAGETPDEGFDNVGTMAAVLLDSAMEKITASATLS